MTNEVDSASMTRMVIKMCSESGFPGQKTPLTIAELIQLAVFSSTLSEPISTGFRESRRPVLPARPTHATAAPKCGELTAEALVGALDGVPQDKLHRLAVAIAASRDALSHSDGR
jgi:hypothetical protein